jgi:hypothetical protein
MRKFISLILLMVLLVGATPMLAGTVTADCAVALLYPQCNWCVTRCVYAIIADLWCGGDGAVDWGIV